MKKTIAAGLAIIFALGMVGCAANGNGQGTAETAGNPLDVLNKVWDSYTDDEKFPAADAGKLSDAASLTHMMNANTFTCGAFRLKDAADADAVCTAIHDGLNSKQWMCGFPDKMVIAKVSGCIVSVYGAEDLVNTFRDKLTAAYENAEIVYDEAIAF